MRPAACFAVICACTCVTGRTARFAADAHVPHPALFRMAANASRGARAASVAPPLIGVVRDCAGNWHRILGVSGSLVLEPAAVPTSTPLGTARRSTVRRQGRTLILRLSGGAEKRLSLPEPAGQLQPLPGDWLAAWPFAIKLTADGAEIYRLPAPVCGGRR